MAGEAAVSAPVTHGLEGSREAVASLRTFYRNPRHGDVAAIRRSLAVNGQYRPVVVNRGTYTGREREVLAGNHTLMAARDEGWSDIAVCWVDVDDDQAARIVAADNRTADLGSYDQEALAGLLDGLSSLDGTGYTNEDLAELLGSGEDEGGPGSDEASKEARRTLAERFGVPPLTLLDARQGYWRERKRAWLDLGIESELGRSDDLLKGYESAARAQQRYDGKDEDTLAYPSVGTSVFDPVLCELLIRWYSPPQGRVLDPFAGGSVRGLLSAALGRAYTGIDLRGEQVAANEAQAAKILPRLQGPLDGEGDYTPTGNTSPGAEILPVPHWVAGDARNTVELVDKGDPADLLLTCPPYFDLEVYGDDPNDLSRCNDYDAFLADYEACLDAASQRCATDAFAAIVTGPIRDKTGCILDLPADTTRIMERLGWRLYQDAILATSIGTAALRSTRPFASSRKLGRSHQAVAVYTRGSLDRIRDWPLPEVGAPSDDDDDGGGDAGASAEANPTRGPE